jgi:hypothetical protein
MQLDLSAVNVSDSSQHVHLRVTHSYCGLISSGFLINQDSARASGSSKGASFLDAPLAGKVAGTRWQGKRTLIDDESDAAEAAGPSEPQKANEAEALPLRNAKWKKLAKAALLEVNFAA